MGYTTYFEGEFKLDKPLDEKTKDFMIHFAGSRRMKRNLTGYGVDGELYVPEDISDCGQEHTADIVDYNRPPSTQPSLWCQWVPNEDGTAIEWDGNEKFYCYVEWIEYIIAKIIAPLGNALNGSVSWRGEDDEDIGIISIVNNKVSVTEGLLPDGTEPKLLN